MKYVVCGREHLRDGFEEWARCFGSIESALQYINKDSCWRTTSYRLFELGKEILLDTEIVEEPQPPKIASRVVLKGV